MAASVALLGACTVLPPTAATCSVDMRLCTPWPSTGVSDPREHHGWTQVVVPIQSEPGQPPAIYHRQRTDPDNT